jgi:hypothetical protein
MIVPIVTCMGRLAYLRQTLPLIIEEFGRAVLVDWSCPQRSGQWARTTLGPDVEVVSVPGQTRFHKTRALNAGAHRAATLGAQWLFFLDADTVIAAGLGVACQRFACRGQFGVGDRVWPGPQSIPELTGVLLVGRADFDRVGGYDEAFRDYGHEDLEMRCRLRLLGGLRAVDLPANHFAAVHHGNALRSQFYPERDLGVSLGRNMSLLRQRVWSWTGRALEQVGEVRDLLFHPPRRPIRSPSWQSLMAAHRANSRKLGRDQAPAARPFSRSARPASLRMVHGRLVTRTVPKSARTAPGASKVPT